MCFVPESRFAPEGSVENIHQIQIHIHVIAKSLFITIRGSALQSGQEAVGSNSNRGRSHYRLRGKGAYVFSSNAQHYKEWKKGEG